MFVYSVSVGDGWIGVSLLSCARAVRRGGWSVRVSFFLWTGRSNGCGRGVL